MPRLSAALKSIVKIFYGHHLELDAVQAEMLLVSLISRTADTNSALIAVVGFSVCGVDKMTETLETHHGGCPALLESVRHG